MDFFLNFFFFTAFSVRHSAGSPVTSPAAFSVVYFFAFSVYCPENQCSDQRSSRIGYNVVQLAVAPSGDELDKFQKETAGKAGRGTPDRSAQSGKRTGNQDSKGDEHEDVFQKEGMFPQSGTPCLKQSQADVGPGAGSAGKESQPQEHGAIEYDKEKEKIMPNLRLPVREGIFLFNDSSEQQKYSPGDDSEREITDGFCHVLYNIRYQCDQIIQNRNLLSFKKIQFRI